MNRHVRYALVMGFALVLVPAASVTTHVSQVNEAAASTMVLFSDGFESGTFAAWSPGVKTGGDGTATVQGSPVQTGAYAAQLSESASGGSYAYARTSLGAAQSDLTVAGDFDTTGEGASGGNVRFFRLYDASGALVVSLYRLNGSGTIGVQYGGTYYSTSKAVALNGWAHLELHLIIAGSGTSTVQVRLNGTLIYQNTAASLGAAGVATVQIGNDTANQAFSQAVDNVAITMESPAPTPTATDTPTVTPIATDTPTVTPAPPISATLFSDGFESGDFAAWSPGVKTGGDGAATVQGSPVQTGAYAAQFSESANSGSYAQARAALTVAQTDLSMAGDFNVSAEGPTTNSVPLMRLFDGTGTRLVNLYRASGTGKLWVQHSGAYYSTSGVLPLNTWGHLAVHVIVAGSGASTVQVSLNANLIYQSTTASLGSAGVKTVQIGDDTARQPFTQSVDNIVVSSANAVPTPTATNTSSPTATATATATPGAVTPLFSDGFESGTFAAWSPGVEVGAGGKAVVESSVVQSGAFAAQLSATSQAQSVAFVRQSFATPQTDLTVTGDFDVTGEGPSGGNVPLVRLFDVAGNRLVALYRQNLNGDKLGLQVLGVFYGTSGTLPLNTWGHVEVHVVIAGNGASTLEVRLNGNLIYQSSTASPGNAGVKTVQIGNDTQSAPFSLYADNITASTTHPAPTATPTGIPTTLNAPKLLIADNLNRRLLITDFSGRLVWEFDNPLGDTNAYNGPIAVRWEPGNQILATFGTGAVGLIDVATKRWVWKITGFNGDTFQSPYDAELLPDGNLAVATRYNQGGRIRVYNLSTGAVVWTYLLCEAHTLEYQEQGYNTTLPTILMGGWGTASATSACTSQASHYGAQEVVYTPNDPSTNYQVTWQMNTQSTHAILPDGPPNYVSAAVGSRYLLTSEGSYLQKVDRQTNAQLWKLSTPDKARRIAINPNGGYIFAIGDGNRIEFRDINGTLLSQWSTLSDGTSLNFPYGIRVIDYTG